MKLLEEIKKERPYHKNKSKVRKLEIYEYILENYEDISQARKEGYSLFQIWQIMRKLNEHISAKKFTYSIFTTYYKRIQKEKEQKKR